MLNIYWLLCSTFFLFNSQQRRADQLSNGWTTQYKTLIYLIYLCVLFLFHYIMHVFTFYYNFLTIFFYNMEKIIISILKTPSSYIDNRSQLDRQTIFYINLGFSPEFYIFLIKVFFFFCMNCLFCKPCFS
jgi:hypothetical protein